MRSASAICIAFLAVTGGLSAGCSEPAIIEGCEPADGLTPICGFQNPEDLASVPGGSWLLVSQYGSGGAEPGSIAAFRRSDHRQRQLFPPDEDSSALEQALAQAPDPIVALESWGDEDCPGPPDRELFSPHGIDLDGTRGRLAVVNHGGREAVELFEVGYARGGPVLVWRGCVVAPEGESLNDVALIDGGGFVTTRIMRSGAGAILGVAQMSLGLDTGYVLAWARESGWERLEGSDGVAPNGVVVSRGGDEIFFAEWGGQRLVRLRRRGDSYERKSVDLPHHPDNITWTRDGRLLVTGQIGRLGDVLACGQIEAGTCALPFSVVAVEPGTLVYDVVLEHDGRAIGAGTVALDVGREIYLGTFAGDRIARAPFDR